MNKEDSHTERSISHSERHVDQAESSAGKVTAVGNAGQAVGSEIDSRLAVVSVAALEAGS